VPKALLGYCPSGARSVRYGPMSLDEIVAEFKRATDEVRMSCASIPAICRSGVRLANSSTVEALDIRFTCTRAFRLRRRAAALAKELTLPEVAHPSC